MSTTSEKSLPDDYDPIAAGYIEREHSQVDPLFALLQEVRDNRAEFEADALYRADWMARADSAVDTIVLFTMRADRRRASEEAESAELEAPKAQGRKASAKREEFSRPEDFLTPEQRLDAIADVLADIALDVLKKRKAEEASTKQGQDEVSEPKR